jgi:hypothetical protein
VSRLDPAVTEKLAKVLARRVLARLPDLGERDRRFLGDMSTWLREPSPKQRAWLAGLALRAGVAA